MKFKLQYIDKVKVPFEPNLALYRGSYFHKCLEHNDLRPNFKTNDIFTEAEKEKVIELVKKFMKTEIWINIQKREYVNELQFAFKYKDKKLVNTSYWNKEAWIRGAIDVHWFEDETLVIADYKTGKDKSRDTRFFTNDQMKPYAIWAFNEYPELNEVHTKFIYVEHTTERYEVFYRKDYTQLVKDLYNDTKACENGERYKKNISPLCNYCAFKEFGHCNGEITSDDLNIGSLDF